MPDALRPMSGPWPSTLDALCDRFEAAWKAGGRPRLEDYLALVPTPYPPRLLWELLSVEVYYRRGQGERPEPAEYQARFPADAELVAAAFSEAETDPHAARRPPAEPAAVSPSTHNSGPAAAVEAWEVKLPTQLGRYRIVARLGAGGFGVVYRGYDDELRRDVAIKVPHAHRVHTTADAEEYLAEARILAGLDHPGIVPVHDLGRTEEGHCYVVSKFIEGGDLAGRLKQGRLPLTEAVEIVASVAEALHHAHQRGLTHRDIKPANILLDPKGRPVVADFGLALREEDFGKGPGFAGTPAYMSPEQARGEGHRVDARTDVYSLGVVFYELLTGRVPFPGSTVEEILDKVTTLEPRPPRQVDDAIPRELDRVCLKCLSKRAADRYSTARDLAEDLRHWQTGERSLPIAPVVAVTPAPPGPAPVTLATTERRPAKVIPKGLRSFDATDADFFLDLLPGPRDRDGLPESLRFWKTRIEETDADKTFTVGLLYGPSGCGKSSLVKAGLLPRLAQHVMAVYIEATAEDTEARLLRGLRKHCPELPAGLGLAEALAALRRGQGLPANQKVLLVLDQFEQWLHAQRHAEKPELIGALRQCDGSRVQAVVLVRDDFWLAVSRFLDALEVELVQGHNLARADLFDRAHARKVLAEFGRSFGRLPDGTQGLAREQEAFLEQAVAGLAEDGWVISVRLALFAEMMKSKPWTPAALKEVGGAAGVGVAFLEETFSSAAASPPHRRHQQAARAILKTLLPEQGSDIKGQLHSADELQRACGYEQRPQDFAQLLRILDGELRLVTPTDPEGKDEGGRMKDERAEASASSLRYYQLTHDYLVPAVRDWLTRKQKETRRGRAELRLGERTAAWAGKPESRQLPAWWEYLNIRLYTRPRDWTAPQQKMMHRAWRYHGLRGLGLLACLALLGWGAWEGYGYLQAQKFLHHLLVANTEDVPGIVRDMAPYRRWLDRPLRQAHAEAGPDERKQLHLSLALLPVDPGQVDYLKRRLLTAEPAEVLAIREGLRSHGDAVRPWLWQVLEDRKRLPAERLRAACLLADYAADDGRWDTVSADVAAALVAQPALVMGRWADALQSVRPHLLRPLANILVEGRGAAQRATVVHVLAGYAEGLPDGFAALEQELTKKAGPQATDEDKLALARRQANAAASLAGMGRWDRVLPLLQQSPDPTVRSYLIERLGSWAVEAQALNEVAEKASEVAVRRALLLALGDFEDRLQPAERDLLIPRLVDLYRNDPDPGMHAAAGWLLREWGRQAEVAKIDAECKGKKPEGEKRWYVNGQGQTMVLVRPGEFWMGEGQERQRRKVEHTFALAATEVTVAQFRRFRGKHEYEKQIAPTEDCPVNQVSWYEAAEYCNWLSKEEGIPKDQWCYEPNDKDQFDKGMKIPVDFLRRIGYRLPTEEEWEYACRAGSDTGWAHGEAIELLGRYAWVDANSSGRSHPAGSRRPNDWGLFDLHGNAWEWCQDGSEQKPAKEIGDKADIVGIKDQESRLLRGGTFNIHALNARSGLRCWLAPAIRGLDIGFRPARTCR